MFVTGLVDWVRFVWEEEEWQLILDW